MLFALSNFNSVPRPRTWHRGIVVDRSDSLPTQRVVPRAGTGSPRRAICRRWRVCVGNSLIADKRKSTVTRLRDCERSGGDEEAHATQARAARICRHREIQRATSPYVRETRRVLAVCGSQQRA